MYKHYTEYGLLTFTINKANKDEDTELVIEPESAIEPNECENTNVEIELESKHDIIYTFKGDVSSIHPMFEWNEDFFELIYKNKPDTFLMTENVIAVVYEIKIGGKLIKISIKMEKKPDDGDLSKKIEKLNLKMDNMKSMMTTLIIDKLLRTDYRPGNPHNHHQDDLSAFLRLTSFIDDSDIPEVKILQIITLYDIDTLKKLVERGYKFPVKSSDSSFINKVAKTYMCHGVLNINQLPIIQLILKNSNITPKDINIEELTTHNLFIKKSYPTHAETIEKCDRILFHMKDYFHYGV
jgi:hypothetical protein